MGKEKGRGNREEKGVGMGKREKRGEGKERRGEAGRGWGGEIEGKEMERCEVRRGRRDGNWEKEKERGVRWEGGGEGVKTTTKPKEGSDVDSRVEHEQQS